MSGESNFPRFTRFIIKDSRYPELKTEWEDITPWIAVEKYLRKLWLERDDPAQWTEDFEVTVEREKPSFGYPLIFIVKQKVEVSFDLTLKKGELEGESQ